MEVTIRFRRRHGPAVPSPDLADTERPVRTLSSKVVWIAIAVLGAALVFALLWLAQEERPSAAATVSDTGPDRPLLEVVDSRMSQAKGFAIVEGTVRNVSPETQQYIWVQAVFVDKAGQPLRRSIEALIDTSTLFPGHSSHFKVSAAWTEGIESYRLEFTKMARTRVAVRDFRPG
jgi:hypothetical protein